MKKLDSWYVGPGEYISREQANTDFRRWKSERDNLFGGLIGLLLIALVLWRKAN